MIRQFPQQVGKKYYSRLKLQVIPTFANGPIQNKQIRDWPCLILFIFLALCYIALVSLFFIYGGDILSTLTSSKIGYINHDTGNNDYISKNSWMQVFYKNFNIIIGMTSLSLGLSIVFLALWSFFPKFTILIAVVTTSLSQITVITLAFIWQMYPLAIATSIVTIINLIVLCCSEQYITKGLILLECSRNFLANRKGILIITIASLSLNILFTAAFVVGLVSEYGSTLEQYNLKQVSRQFFYYINISYLVLTAFFIYFLYYFMVFLLSTAIGYEYYQLEKNYLEAFITVGKYLGSLAYIAMIIPFTTFIKILGQQVRVKQNCVVNPFYLMLGCVRGYIDILNHHSIIIMSITGQDFANSARSAVGLISCYYPLFTVIDFTTNLVQFYSLCFCIILPSLIGVIKSYLQTDSQYAKDTASMQFFIICLLSWMLTSVILGTSYEVLSSQYIISSLNKELQKNGIVIGNQDQMRGNSTFSADRTNTSRQKSSFGLQKQTRMHVPIPQQSNRYQSSQNMIRREIVQKRRRQHKQKQNQNYKQIKDPNINPITPFFHTNGIMNERTDEDYELQQYERTKQHQNKLNNEINATNNFNDQKKQKQQKQMKKQQEQGIEINFEQSFNDRSISNKLMNNQKNSQNDQFGQQNQL